MITTKVTICSQVLFLAGLLAVITFLNVFLMHIFHYFLTFKWIFL